MRDGERPARPHRDQPLDAEPSFDNAAPRNAKSPGARSGISQPGLDGLDDPAATRLATRQATGGWTMLNAA
jgi:hypothetical protein